MRYKFKFFLPFLMYTLLSSALHADHPIFIMLTHPRATGTAFEKVMRTQENMTVLHVPYFGAYVGKKYGLEHPYTLAMPDKMLTFEAVTNKLLMLAKTNPVFFKESSHVLFDYLLEHPEFYKNSQVRIAFLVRDPAKSVVSFYKKMPTVNETVLNYKQLWELFVLLKDELDEIPFVIDSDEFLKDPLHVLNHLGQHWGMEFTHENLQWESGYAWDWHLKEWYVEVASSTKLWNYGGDVLRNEEGMPKYLEITDENDRQFLQNLYKLQKPYYANFLQYAIKASP